MTGALDGIRVLEFANYVAGPYAGMILGDLGAEVIKVEQPAGGDPFRDWGDGSFSPIFEALNRNKKSVTVDLKAQNDQEKIRKLIQTADVIIENFRPGTMDRMGLGYPTLTRKQPRLIYCSITGFGPTGPYSDRPGYDTIGQAMGGLLSLMTDLSDPKPVGYSFSDHFAGTAAMQGIMAALFTRERTGRGQLVETSLLQSTIAMIGENAARYLFDGTVPDRERRTQLAQVYAFLDRDALPFVIHLSSPEKFWQALIKAIGHEELGRDERFGDRTARMKNFKILHGRLSEIFKLQSRDYWLSRLQKNDVPASPINTLAEVFNDPQVKHLDLKETLNSSLGTSFELVCSGFNLEDTPLSIRKRAPALGEHNSELLT